MLSFKDLLSLPKPDAECGRRVREHLDNLTKPRGSLGRLEDLAVNLAEITGLDRPRFSKKAVLVAAGDHGVVAEGVAAYPKEVTRQMVENFLGGGAAINCFANLAGAKVIVADFGVDAEFGKRTYLRDAKIRRGTGNIAREPAMSQAEAMRAVALGATIVQEEHAAGLDLLALGEMGIGNTTPSSCLIAAFTGKPADRLVGRGTGLDDAGLERKRKVVGQALALHQPADSAPLDTLAALGGFEIAGLAGAALGAARARIPVIIDGFISTAAALAACRIAPGLERFLIAGHRSTEPGHIAALDAMELKPLLSLNMRLGEGTGAALAMTLVEASVRVLDEMTTFKKAGVSDQGEGKASS